jgi:hypothetical protein
MVLHVTDVVAQGSMKTNDTLKLDADLLREARVMAAYGHVPVVNPLV